MASETTECPCCRDTHWIVMYTPQPVKAPCFVCNMDGSKPEARVAGATQEGEG